MNPYELYCEYVSIKRHFSDWRYDYERYGPARIKPETFEKRNDVWKFRALAKRTEPRWTIISVLARNENAWIGDMLTDEAVEIRDGSRGRIESMTATIKRELDGIDPSDLMSFKDGRHPLLAREVMGGRISMETGSIVLGVTNQGLAWKERLGDDPVMGPLVRRMMRYYPFLEINRDLALKTILQAFQDRI